VKAVSSPEVMKPLPVDPLLHLQCPVFVESLLGTIVLVPSCLNMNQLYIKIKFDTFEQLMLHYDFCTFSFSELLNWIKLCVEIT
jgi:hypothetical protein